MIGRFVGPFLREQSLHSPKRVLFLDLVLTLFRLNGLLIAEGDAMTKDLGLTHARWKVIGAMPCLMPVLLFRALLGFWVNRVRRYKGLLT